VRQWLEKRYGRKMLYEGGLTVETACDPTLTRYGRQAIAKGLASLTKRQGYLGPLKRLSPAELKAVRQRPLGPAGLEPGKAVRAVVTGVDLVEQRAKLRLGSARGFIDLDRVRWAKPPIKHLKQRRLRLANIGQVFQPGDVVLVRPLSKPQAGNWWKLELVQEPWAQAALLALENHSGRVRVLIGGSDFNKSQFNRALQARRQPGSAFKPIIYAAALDHPNLVYTSRSVVLDSPVVYEDPNEPGEKWRPKNYSSKFYGPTTLRTALARSRNVVTVKLLSDLGMGYTIGYARRFGLTSQLAPNLSLALGTSGMSLLELTRAYGVFADQGQLMEAVFVERVTGRDGQVLYEARPQRKQVISPATAYLMTHLLKGVIQNGTGRRMRALKRPLAGKTGTTNDLRDAWFMGFSPQLICGVWVGQDDNRPLGKKETGSRAAGPIWQDFMTEALKDLPAEDFPVPPGVVFARVDRVSGEPVAAGVRGGFFESFFLGRQPGAAGQEPAAKEGQRPQDFLQAESFAKPEVIPVQEAPPETVESE
jgi:penicillin-binding protein 1A